MSRAVSFALGPGSKRGRSRFEEDTIDGSISTSSSSSVSPKEKARKDPRSRPHDERSTSSRHLGEGSKRMRASVEEDTIGKSASLSSSSPVFSSNKAANSVPHHRHNRQDARDDRIERAREQLSRDGHEVDDIWFAGTRRLDTPCSNFYKLGVCRFKEQCIYVHRCANCGAIDDHALHECKKKLAKKLSWLPIGKQ